MNLRKTTTKKKKKREREREREITMIQTHSNGDKNSVGLLKY